MATVNYIPIIPGYQINSQLYAGSRTNVYRAIRQLDQLPVVIKLLTLEYPSFNELLQFRHQYTISKNLNIAGIIHPLSLETYSNSYILVMADIGEISLREYIKNSSLSLIEVLNIAIQLVRIIHDLHESRIIHKDIKPANILIYPHTRQIQLIDFSIASLLPKETQEIKNPNVLEGTIAYISPEQTGRMNRGIDYRSDYYSLGVTFYEILTGKLPFNCDDPMELVHCHLAKMPSQLEARSKEIPKVLWNIVMKLMAKNAEDRYQSALGLKHDLELCLAQIQDTGKIRDFEIGQWDVCARFLIPEKLYGRKAEVASLLQAFERVAHGTSEIMLVAGFSGIGKTAVVNEVHKPITRQRGYFIKGKFDQFNRNIPLSAFVQALRDLMAQLLSESDTQLVHWRNQIRQVLGENGQVLIEVIPELEQVIGKQPLAPELSGTAVQNRFNLLFQKFIAVFTTREHPLVMFLDDLQWADLASLQLIKLLMKNQKYLLLLGAYRDNEVSAAHPFMLKVEELKKAGKTVNTITLAPLELSDTNQLVANTLHCTTQISLPLTELINRKTKGNPFFITQFLKALYEDKQIKFNHQQGYWECDFAQVNVLSVTDDVVEFMATQLQKLPQQTQNVLKLAACIGNSFDLTTLAIVSQQLPQQVADALWKALQEGLILPQSQVYKFYLSHEQEVNTNNIKNVAYRFLHDRVQQAAYCLIPEDQKQATHLAIGQLLHANTPTTQLDTYIFEIVNHFNIGIDLITQPDKKLELAQLNLLAGRKAKVAIAYNLAVKYCTQGIDLLPFDAWTEHYKLTLNLHNERLEAACLNTDFNKLAGWGDIILQSATSLLDTIKVYETRMTAFRSQGQFAKVVETGLQVLKLLGVEFPEQPTMADISAATQQTRQLWMGRAPLSLLDLAAMNDPHQLAAMQIMTTLVSSAYIGKPTLLPLLTSKQVEMAIQFGNSSIAIFSYADYGVTLCGLIGDIDAGYEFGQLSLKLLEQHQINAFKSRAYFIVNSFIRHWKEPLNHSIPSLLEAYQSGLETGDWVCMALNLVSYSQCSYWSGRELNDLAEEMETYRQVISQGKQEATLKYQECYQQAILNLLGQAEIPYCLEGKVFNAAQILPSLQAASNRTGLFYLHLNQAVLCYLFGEYEAASQQAALAEQYSNAVTGYFVVAVRVFYDALIHLARYTDVNAQEQSAILERINAHQKKLQTWATYAPFNHQHRWQLVAAERYQVLGQFTEAMEHYDLAIAQAKTHGYLQDEALSNELAAKFYLSWGKQKVAAGYMQEAYYCYARWGAKAKTEDLENRYPDLVRVILQQRVQSLQMLETISSSVSRPLSVHNSTHLGRSSSTDISSFDFAAILKASQAISGTIQLDELLHRLTQIILQHSGGERCALILPNTQGKWLVRAIATPENTELCAEPLEGNPNLPIKLIQYVKNTEEIVMIDELKTNLPVIDEYLSQRQPKSLLCLPILNQGRLIGILYLKNRSTSSVFTSDRILILNFLCTQAAISLENARLYQDGQIYTQQLEQSLEKLRLSEARFQKLADNIPGMIYQIRIKADGSASVPYVSSGCQTLYEVPAEDFLSGKCSLRDFEHPDDGAEAFRAVVESAQNLTPFQHEWRIVTPNGNIKWVKAASQPERGEDGEMVWDGILIDISDRKLGEAAVKHKSQELENALQELQQAQLQMIQHEKMSALGNLVAGVAHEMNNPLGFISTSLQQAKPILADITEHLKLYQKALPNPEVEILDHAEEIDLDYSLEDMPNMVDAMLIASERLKNISTSLRTFSRGDKDYKVPFNINEGIDSTILILKHRLKANEQRPEIIVVTEYDNLQPIECFPGQLNQVFMNILANAIDALDESSRGQSFEHFKLNPHIIRVKAIIENHILKISIADNGTGINEDVKARIFDHLFTTKGVGKGTGLGLAIAQQIVEEIHGGRIEVNSVLGKGTEFVIYIPITEKLFIKEI
ncbi:AAA family ATPase [Nostoc sp. ChiSLP03a]|uniref:trifunctional serine/threonine-protein kinase/ATP-binding protein/sensor histidine kinase n=1 Tax=Nostoc sp. ChiSLP03a TaxID=3075380 RepID=UPI002AD5191B|nr:AAA family ATPase [Nostoc sp. ChiSLP03a]MDZ8211826.1 AAA family ATPase [Nostoc sp. ChiSLP03a]